MNLDDKVKKGFKITGGVIGATLPSIAFSALMAKDLELGLQFYGFYTLARAAGIFVPPLAIDSMKLFTPEVLGYCVGSKVTEKYL